jgi:hypothetical protein
MSNPSNTTIDSEHYRQMLVRDGQRRFDEWHGEFLRYQREFIQSLENEHDPQEFVHDGKPPYPIANERYRQMLVRDGQRRFKEWHDKFLSYQKKFLQG